MKRQKYIFPLSLQTLLPEGYTKDAAFRKQLSMLQELGFSGIELNIIKPESVKAEELTGFLAEFDLWCTRFASGAFARASGLSLSHERAEVRERSNRKCLHLIDFASRLNLAIIIGFLKGGTAQNTTTARKFFMQSLQRIAPYAREKKVKLIIEATNRFECAVANTLEDTVAMLEDLTHYPVRMLPDTYHMSVEEEDIHVALQKYVHYYDWIHFSDNNRCFPGLGSLPFAEILDTLKSIGYRGGVTLEGNIRNSFVADLQESMDYLIPMLQ
jgi:sugar phosphate isomerase/epimerase